MEGRPEGDEEEQGGLPHIRNDEEFWRQREWFTDVPAGKLSYTVIFPVDDEMT